MEKKNTILLTVIAVATLLVAVVGATFAYFTATTTGGTNEGVVNTTTAPKLGSVSLNMAPLATSNTEGVNIYPGYMFYAGASVTSTDTDENVDFKTTYTLNGVVENGTGTKLTYTLYKAAADVEAPVTGCESKEVPQTNGETHYYYTGCKVADNIGTPVADYTDVEVAAGETSNITLANEEIFTDGTNRYYLVVNYPNEGDQTENDTNKAIKLALTSVDNASSVQKK